MQHGHCPRCAATSIVSNAITFRENMEWAVMRAAVYVCTACGLVEWYMPPEHRNELSAAMGWLRVPVASEPPSAYTGATQRLAAPEEE